MVGKYDSEKKQKNAHLWARDPDDHYVEPDWTCDALFQKIKFQGQIVDPCCGLGRVLDAAKRAGYETAGADIADRGASANHKFAIDDFFKSTGLFDNIVCNPPYKFDDEFLALAIMRVRFRLAILLRTQWANSGKRSKWLETLPLYCVLALTPRPSMPPGAVIKAGIEPSGGLQDYSWFVFEAGYHGRSYFGWAHKPPRVKKALDV